MTLNLHGSLPLTDRLQDDGLGSAVDRDEVNLAPRRR